MSFGWLPQSIARALQRPVDLRHRLEAGRVFAGFDAADRLLANLESE